MRGQISALFPAVSANITISLKNRISPFFILNASSFNLIFWSNPALPIPMIFAGRTWMLYSYPVLLHIPIYLLFHRREDKPLVPTEIRSYARAAVFQKRRE